MRPINPETVQYRRADDEPARLLILLNERVKVMQESVEKLTEKQGKTPCSTHEIRIKALEKIIWVVVSAIIILTLKAAFSLFTSLP